MKKFTALFIAAVMCAVSLCSCSLRKFSLTVNNMNIDEEIFNYYKSVAENDYEYSGNNDKEGITLELCRNYAAGCELAEKYKVSVSAEEKVMISKETKAQWQYYEKFYEKYSVSKQTLNKMIEYNYLVDDIIIKIYSEKGESPVPEKEIKAYYNKNYISAEIISAEIKNNKDELTKKFMELQKIAVSGAGMDTAAQQYPDITKYNGSAEMISSFDTSYPKGFFENISQIKKGELKIMVYGSSIYLVRIADDDTAEQMYPVYYKKCLVRMKKKDIKNRINTIAQSYKMVYNKG